MLKTVFVTAQIVAILSTALYTIPALAKDNSFMFIDSVVAESRVDEVQLKCMGEALYWEARNQSVKGMTGVAHVIMNRVDSKYFPDTVCGVVHQGPRNGSPIKLNRCQFSYFCDGKGDAYPVNSNFDEVLAAEVADLIAENVMYNGVDDTTAGSDHYHANYVSPRWNKVYPLRTTIDTHLFYAAY
jgi:spore germination cell wall hydrolase CwlJ-like protein